MQARRSAASEMRGEQQVTIEIKEQEWIFAVRYAHSGPAPASSPYSASTLVIEPLGDAAVPAMDESARAQALENQNRLLTLLSRVARTFNAIHTVENPEQSSLEFALEIGGAERGFVMLLDEER